MATETSLLVLLPALVTVVTAILSRRPIESLLAGVFVGLLMLEPAAALSNFSSILLDVMMDETIAWIIIVCGLMGSLITLLMRVGAANAFSRALSSKAKIQKAPCSTPGCWAWLCLSTTISMPLPSAHRCARSRISLKCREKCLPM